MSQTNLKLKNISKDRTIATFTESEGGETCCEALLLEEYHEIITTPNMIRRALVGFEGTEMITFGVSAIHPDTHNASVIRIQNEKKTVLMAGAWKQ